MDLLVLARGLWRKERLSWMDLWYWRRHADEWVVVVKGFVVVSVAFRVFMVSLWGVSRPWRNHSGECAVFPNELAVPGADVRVTAQVFPDD
jgi:hypothetical protein